MWKILVLILSCQVLITSTDNEKIMLDGDLVESAYNLGKQFLMDEASKYLNENSINGNQIVSTLLKSDLFNELLRSDLVSGLVQPDIVIQLLQSNVLSLLPTMSMSYIIDIAVDAGFVASNLTARCAYEVKFYLKSMLSSEYGGPFNFWTVQLLDSLAKLPSGVAQGNINWMGDFDQCVNIEVYKSKDKTGKADFKGEYCLVMVAFDQQEGAPPPSVYPKLGVCLPSGCNTNDKLLILNTWLFMMPFKLGIQENYCHTKDGSSWTIYGTIAVLMIVGLVLACLAGSAYELLLIFDGYLDNRYEVRQRFPDILHDLLMAFSLIKNTAKIFSFTEEGNTIPAIHGLKTLSLVWIAAVHVAVMAFQDYPWKNQLKAMEIARRDSLILQLFADAALVTDTFFVISGMLVTYLTLNTFKRLKVKFSLTQFYLYRYWRLTPPYVVILFVLNGLVVHFGDGPLWALIQNDMKKCEDKWWRNVLYIQNLYPDFYDQCLLPSWYLAVDTQLYFMAPIFLIPLMKRPKLGVMMIFVVIGITTITPAILTYVYDLETYTGMFSRKPNMDRFAEILYNKPWNRMSTYLIGMAVGYVMHTKGKTVTFKSATIVTAHVVAICTGALILFGPVEYFRGKPMPPLLYAIYGGFTRPAWGACMAWLVYSCYLGYGSLVNSVLSAKFLLPLSRLSYSFYLSHMLVVHHYYYSRQDNLRIEYLGMIIMYCGIVVVSFFLAYLLSVFVESPAIELLHIFVKLRTGGSTRVNKSDYERKTLEHKEDSHLENGVNDRKRRPKGLNQANGDFMLAESNAIRRRPTPNETKAKQHI